MAVVGAVAPVVVDVVDCRAEFVANEVVGAVVVAAAAVATSF